MKMNGADWSSTKWAVWVFVLIQVGIMLLAITNESLWIDEFWTGCFVLKDNLQDLMVQWSNPQVVLTPLYFIYFYFWGLFFHSGEMVMRLANLPLFVLGQLSLFLALRTYPKRFSFLLLLLSALHPMVWQYANEARPYMMMYAGAEMILAYILHIHTLQSRDDYVAPLFSGIFVLGCILLMGASMVGGFWVLVALVYVVYFHYVHLNFYYLKLRVNLFYIGILLFTLALLGFMYIWAVLRGGTASVLGGTNVATLAFDAYELMGLSGIGPGRLELRESGVAALRNYWVWLILATAMVTIIAIKGLQEAVKWIGFQRVIVVVMICLLPVLIVVSAGFVTHWRVLGRHFIGGLPMINLIFSLGLVNLLDRPKEQKWQLRSVVAWAFLLMLTFSTFSMRFSERHRKDDYQGAAIIAKQDIALGKQVWWAADVFGAGYYGLVKVDKEIRLMPPANEVASRLFKCGQISTGFNLVANESKECLVSLMPPDVVILSKPETFDRQGAITAYLNSHGFVKVQSLPAFSIWRSATDSPLNDSSTLNEVH